MSILVTGATGLVGRSLTLKDAITHPCDLRVPRALDNVIRANQVETVVHLAAKVGGIQANLGDPVGFLRDNLLIDTNTVTSAFQNDVGTFLGLLSTCIFPATHTEYPMTEEDICKGAPTPENYSYAMAKRSLMALLDAHKAQYGVNYSYLIPCNLYSADAKNDYKSNHFVTDLIYKILEYKQTGRKVTLLGTGRALRQFMLVDDLAAAINLWLANKDTENYIIATPETLSIMDMVEQAIEITGIEKEAIQFDGIERFDGQFRKDCSSVKWISNYPTFKFTLFKDGFKYAYDKISRRYNR